MFHIKFRSKILFLILILILILTLKKMYLQHIKQVFSIKLPNDTLILIKIRLNPEIDSNWFIKNWLNRSQCIVGYNIHKAPVHSIILYYAARGRSWTFHVTCDVRPLVAYYIFHNTGTWRVCFVSVNKVSKFYTGFTMTIQKNRRVCTSRQNLRHFAVRCYREKHLSTSIKYRRFREKYKKYMWAGILLHAIKLKTTHSYESHHYGGCNQSLTSHAST